MVRLDSFVRSSPALVEYHAVIMFGGPHCTVESLLASSPVALGSILGAFPVF